jgi:cyclic pyranopterin phosphate synthase
MPEEGIRLLSHDEILSYEEIVEVVKFAVSQGIHKVRITGGEPLVRRQITKLVKMIADIEGITDFSLTTNGVLLKEFAISLAKAGLHRINVSLDTLDENKYKEITRGGDISRVIEGMNEASLAGLNPIKVNMVMSEYVTEKDKKDLKSFCDKNAYDLRFIRKMDLKKGTFSVVEGGHGGDCPRCNRIRLTSNGMLKPCLFSDTSYNIRDLGIEKAFNLAIENKPKSGSQNSTCAFFRIGG